MKIKLIRNTVVKGEARTAGEIIADVPEAEAHLLVGIRKAVWVDESRVETADAALPAEIEARVVPPPPTRKKKASES